MLRSKDLYLLNTIFNDFIHLSNNIGLSSKIQHDKANKIFITLQYLYELSTDMFRDNDSGSDVVPCLITTDMDEDQIWHQIELWNLSYFETIIPQYDHLYLYKPILLEVICQKEDNVNYSIRKPSKNGLLTFKSKRLSFKKSITNNQLLFGHEYGEEIHYFRDTLQNMDYEISCKGFQSSLNNVLNENCNKKNFLIKNDSKCSKSTTVFVNLMDKSKAEFRANNFLQSTFEIEKEESVKTMQVYEANALYAKQWQLLGEVKASNRPINSLLEETLEFDAPRRSTTNLTEKTTQCLESIIKQRIKNQTWDDVIPVPNLKFDLIQDGKNEVLETMKPKIALSEFYEKQFEHVSNRKYCKDSINHNEVKSSLQILFWKLDSLSNFYLKSSLKPLEPNIVPILPALYVEEVAPLTTNNLDLIAPKEAYNKISRKSNMEPSEKSVRINNGKAKLPYKRFGNTKA